jgi:metal-responsive CopG/Arc/MetJ family transcriptional regulator
MMDTTNDRQILSFALPIALVRRLDEVAREEMLSRSDVIRRAVRWELLAVEDRSP